MGPAQPVNLVSLRMFHSVMGPWDKSLLLMKDRCPTVPQLQQAGRHPQAA